MTVLTITVIPQGLLAIETHCGDDVKYVETFSTWADLLNAISSYFSEYAWIEVKR